MQLKNSNTSPNNKKEKNGRCFFKNFFLRTAFLKKISLKKPPLKKKLLKKPFLRKILLFLIILTKFIKAEPTSLWSEAKIEELKDGVSITFDSKATLNMVNKRALAAVYVKIPFANNCNDVDIKFLFIGEPLKNNILNINEQKVKFKLGMGFATLMSGKNTTRQLVEPESKADKNLIVKEFKTKQQIVLVEDNKKTYTIQTQGFFKALENISQICKNKNKK